MALTLTVDSDFWKQRVGKEMGARNRFNNYTQTMRSSQQGPFYKSDNLESSPEKRTMRRSGSFSHFRSTHHTRYSSLSDSLASTIQSSPVLSRYFDEDNYKHSDLNHAYSFGGTYSARFAFSTP
jgi:hypothetical protein